jgi:hypothetical protein
MAHTSREPRLFLTFLTYDPTHQILTFLVYDPAHRLSMNVDQICLGFVLNCANSFTTISLLLSSFLLTLGTMIYRMRLPTRAQHTMLNTARSTARSAWYCYKNALASATRESAVGISAHWSPSMSTLCVHMASFCSRNHPVRYPVVSVLFIELSSY